MNKLFGVIAFVLIAAVALIFAITLWPLTLVFFVVAAYQLTAIFFKVKNVLILKIVFIGLYFFLFSVISIYLHKNNITLSPEIDYQSHCMNGYVCD